MGGIGQCSLLLKWTWGPPLPDRCRDENEGVASRLSGLAAAFGCLAALAATAVAVRHRSCCARLPVERLTRMAGQPTKMNVPRIKSALFADQSPVRADCRLMNHIDQYGSTQLIARLKFTVLILILERRLGITH